MISNLSQTVWFKRFFLFVSDINRRFEAIIHPPTFLPEDADCRPPARPPRWPPPWLPPRILTMWRSRSSTAASTPASTSPTRSWTTTTALPGFSSAHASRPSQVSSCMVNRRAPAVPRRSDDSLFDGGKVMPFPRPA